MEIGINLMLFAGAAQEDTGALFAQLREMGYTHVEVPVFELDRKRTRELGRLAAETGLSVSVSSALPANASLVESAEEIEAGVAFHRMLVEAAQDLRADLVVGPMYHPVGAIAQPCDQAELQKRLTDTLANKLADIYRDSGVRFALEPLNRFETNVVNTCADAARICVEVGEPWLGILTDTFHQHIEEADAAAPLLELGESWIHAHASECHRGVAGSGQVAWDAWVDAVMVKGPRLVVFESFGAAVPELAAATRVWRDLTGEPLSCAEASLRFLNSRLKP